MAITVICRNGFTATGDLAGFDEGSAQLTFKFKGGTSVEIPNPSPNMVASLSQIGLALLGNAEINFVTNKVAIKGKANMAEQERAMASVNVGMAR